jgi:hypothetical protein
VTNRQKRKDFHSRQPSPISLTQPSGHDSHAASYAPAAVWRTIQSCLNDSIVENTCLNRRRPQMPKLEMLTPQNSAIAMIDYQPAMYQSVRPHDRLETFDNIQFFWPRRPKT